MQRPIFKELLKRAKEPRRFIQVLLGPRQVGKTTMALQLQHELKCPTHFISADTATLQDLAWLEVEWERARLLASADCPSLLIIDEVQKIPQWSSVIKKLWDDDKRHRINMKVILLGSSPWLMQKGLTESLAGRFELLHVTHWSFYEMQKGFDFDLDQFVFYGGYPGAAQLIDDNQRWQNYINDTLIETTISRDILLMTQVNKPALLRRLFQLGCIYSSQILSYTKIQGQLQDAGNTTTLAHYLELLTGAGMIGGIQKYANQLMRSKGSSPKLQVYNTALMSACAHMTLEEAKADRNYWGRLVESSVGAHLVNSIKGTQIELYYWREGSKEVDFVLKYGKVLIAIEVKSSAKTPKISGIDAFKKAFQPKRVLVIGGPGIPLDEFFLTPIQDYLSAS